MKTLFFTLLAFISLTIASCNKSCQTCVGGEWDGLEICPEDGYGRLTTKSFKQDCRAGGGNIK